MRRACDYYHVSADYLLGRTLSRDGGMIDAEELYDSSEEKGTLRGSIAATLQKKLIVNSANLLFELLGRTESREAVTAAGSYLSGALYQLYRTLHRKSGGNDGYFALSGEAFLSSAVDVQMAAARVAYTQALSEAAQETALPAMEDEALTQTYPALVQSAKQTLHTAEEQALSLTAKK